MKRQTCPYLGLIDDPTTSYNFPSDGNYCHNAKPKAPVRASYQAARCLTEGHTACPLYRAPRPAPMPIAMMTPQNAQARTRRVVALAVIPLLLFASVALALVLDSLTPENLAIFRIPNTGEEQGFLQSQPNGWRSLLSRQQSGFSSQTPSNPNRISETEQKALDNCPLPPGWVTYIVNPTDSLFRLSIIYGVTVDELQKVNCMGEDTAILPGQVVYVPYIPTKTPLIQPTPTQVVEPTTARPRVFVLPTTDAPDSPPAPATAPQQTINPSPTVQPTRIPSKTNTKAPTSTVSATTVPTNTPKPTNTPVTPTPIPPTATQRPTRRPTNTPVTPTTPPAPTDPPTPVPTTPPAPTDPPTPVPTTPPAPTDPPTPVPTTPPAVTDPPTPVPTTPPAATDPPTPVPTDPPPPDPTDPPAPGPPPPPNPPPPPPNPSPPPPPDPTDPPPPDPPPASSQPPPVNPTDPINPTDPVS